MPPDSSTQVTTPAPRSRVLQRLAFCLACIGPAAGAMVACVFRPDRLAALILIPPWIWVVLAGPCLLWAVRSGRRKLAILLLAGWSAFAVGWVEELTSLALGPWRQLTGVPVSWTVRVVSLNCANTVRCVDDLKAVHPDVVLLQETPGSDDLREMAQQLFGPEGAVLIGHDTAILTRGRVRPAATPNPGMSVSGIVDLEGLPPIHCISLRRSPPISRLDFWTADFWADHRQLRGRHQKELSDVLNGLPEVPRDTLRIVGGDFNAPPLDPTLEQLGQAGLEDAFPRHGVGLGGTGTNDYPLFRVDQIWTDFRIQQVMAYKTKHSDHRMVVCDLIPSP